MIPFLFGFLTAIGLLFILALCKSASEPPDVKEYFDAMDQAATLRRMRMECMNHDGASLNDGGGR